jgi:D-alanine transaminase
MAEPLPTAYLNGSFLPLREARISPLDRGFLFADGVYEVIPVFGGRPFRFGPHFARLARSLAEIRMREPHDLEGWRTICRELIAANGGGDQYLYFQVTRGAEYGRNHAPLPDLEPTVFAFAAPLPRPDARQLATGAACITAADTRWARCDIKSIALLPNILLRQLAVDAGAGETILLRDGWLMEGSASSVHVVVDGEVLSPPNSTWILPGTTRSVVEELLLELGIPHRSTPVAEATLRAADEIWLGAATRDITAVTRLDGQPVGAGAPGPVWQRVHRGFRQLVTRIAGAPW